MHRPRIVFMGTPEFAVPSLEILIKSGYGIAAVITAPDKPAGRGQQVQQSPVKKYALEKGLHILQPVKLRDESFLRELRELNADLFIVVAFRMLPEAVWKMPRLGTFNLHASLLPRYRGAAPINRVLMNGEKETGITTFFLRHEIDTGQVIFREKVPVGENETAGELHDKLMYKGADLVLKTVQAIEKGDYHLTPQEELGEGTLKTAPRLFKEDCRINWNLTGKQVHNLIRGLSPYPGAWTELASPDGQELILKIYKSALSGENRACKPGEIIIRGKRELCICTGEGIIEVLELQLAGKRKMKTDEFLRGLPLNESWSVT